jgi:metal-dependent amidase/aminoacylase/carboxypeptidase family protein
MIPTLEAGKENVSITPVTGAEDFSYYQKNCTFFWWCPKGKPISETAPHHTPDFTSMKAVFC